MEKIKFVRVNHSPKIMSYGDILEIFEDFSLRFYEDYNPKKRGRSHDLMTAGSKLFGLGFIFIYLIN